MVRTSGFIVAGLLGVLAIICMDGQSQRLGRDALGELVGGGVKECYWPFGVCASPCQLSGLTCRACKSTQWYDECVESPDYADYCIQYYPTIDPHYCYFLYWGEYDMGSGTCDDCPDETQNACGRMPEVFYDLSDPCDCY